jgi:release factor glutamine methyltransferase
MKQLLEVLQSGASYLSKRGVDEARLNMEHLTAHVLRCRRMELYLRFDQVLPEAELVELRTLLKRRGEGEPLQHLLGTVEFYGLELISDHRALVPRPETEYLVERLVKGFVAPVPARVLDMCTGSGCIGLALARAWPAAQLTLVDVSEDALELARLNASRLGLEQVKLLRSDLFEKLAGAQWDLIVSNPPYIPTAELTTLSREVRRDPHLALDGGANGLLLVERLLAGARLQLALGAQMVMEIGMGQAADVVALAETAGLGSCRVEQDLQGVERFVWATQVSQPPAPALLVPETEPTESAAAAADTPA